jgi:hypothetical protein
VQGGSHFVDWTAGTALAPELERESEQELELELELEPKPELELVLEPESEPELETPPSPAMDAPSPPRLGVASEDTKIYDRDRLNHTHTSRPPYSCSGMSL